MSYQGGGMKSQFKKHNARKLVHIPFLSSWIQVDRKVNLGNSFIDFSSYVLPLNYFGMFSLNYM